MGVMYCDCNHYYYYMYNSTLKGAKLIAMYAWPDWKTISYDEMNAIAVTV